MSVQIARHWFTVAEYNRMGETGIFSEDDRVELIEGEIFEMSPIGKRSEIAEVWIVNLMDEQIEIYPQPASGAYQSQRQAVRGETINLPDTFNLTLSVDDIPG